MSQERAHLRVDGLTSLQLAELQTAIASAAGSASITALDSPNLGGGKVGEPTLLTAVITLGPAAISALALWLSKQKKGRARKLRYTKIDTKGGMESFELDESSYDEGESPSNAIQAFLTKKLANDTAAPS